MTAISQYYCYHNWPTLKDPQHVLRCRGKRCQEISLIFLDAITEFHDKIKEHIPMADYVIDFVVYSDFTCHVIELNPFGAAMSSGSALFHWLKDYRLLYGLLDLEKPVIRVAESIENDDM